MKTHQKEKLTKLIDNQINRLEGIKRELENDDFNRIDSINSAAHYWQNAIFKRIETIVKKQKLQQAEEKGWWQDPAGG